MMRLELTEESLAIGPPPPGPRLVEPRASYQPDLTPRQREILALIARGRSNKEIAFALGIRERTVKFHVASLFEKLGTSSRTQALVVALRLGVVHLDDTF